MSDAMTTTNHEVIRAWIEARAGRPAVSNISGKGVILQVDFGEAEQDFHEIAWDDFFRRIDDNNLAFLHQDMTEDGVTSHFSRFVSRCRRYEISRLEKV